MLSNLDLPRRGPPAAAQAFVPNTRELATARFYAAESPNNGEDDCSASVLRVVAAQNGQNQRAIIRACGDDGFSKAAVIAAVKRLLSLRKLDFREGARGAHEYFIPDCSTVPDCSATVPERWTP